MKSLNLTLTTFHSLKDFIERDRNQSIERSLLEFQEVVDHETELQERFFLAHFSEVLQASETIDFAATKFFGGTKKKAKNCVKGWACGYTCLSKTVKNCKKTLEGQAKTYAEWVRQQKGKSGAKPKADSKGAFPDNLDGLEVVKSLGGSTGAMLVRDPATGKLYVKKTGNSPDHIRSEAAADNAYAALGVNVPKHQLYETQNGPIKLAEYIEGRSLRQVLESGSAKERTATLTELQKHYAADALLGNWDVIGMDADNVQIGNDGKVYRIDNGGALGYRAQGAKKTAEQWDKNPSELWTMKDLETNAQSASVFGKLKHSEIVAQIDSISAKKKQLLAALPKEIQETVRGRIEEMERVAKVSKTLADDSWNDDYISSFTKHTVGIRKAGITAKLPSELKQKGKGVTVLDENGKAFDNLRGENSTMYDVKQYIDSNGGNYEAVQKWGQGQAGTSWSRPAQALKYHIVEQRSKSKDDYFWRNGLQDAKEDYETYCDVAGGKKKYTETMAAYHAFNYELLSKANITNKEGETVTLIRTEDKKVMKAYGLNPGDTNVKMKRGASESTSLLKPTYVYGTEVTVQKVPLHRIFGTYLNESTPGRKDNFLYGDKENEFVALLDDIPLDYQKKQKKTHPLVK